MKILLVNYDMSVYGGTERVVVNLANSLAKENHNITILSVYKKNSLLPFSLHENINLHFLYKNTEKWFKSKKITAIKKIINNIIINKIINQWGGVDVVLSNDYQSFIPILKLKNTRYVKIIHGNFNVYMQCNNLSYFHDIVILTNKELKQWKERHQNIHIIPNFLPYIPSQKTDYKQKNILSIGRFTQDDLKGFSRLIDIWKIIQNDTRYKEWTLTIVGEGDGQETIQAKIQNNNLEKSIQIKPFTQDIEKEYLNASIYLMCSHYEGFPMVLLEALSFGLPLIAFDIKTGPSDVIDDEKNGYLIPNNDIFSFAQKTQTLMENKDLRIQMGEKSKQKAINDFSEKVIMSKWKKILNF
ncbi:glycosyltransferase family 4 protein [Campylobacter sp. VTCC 70190]|uniref:glycosyltransferase family 4 protein n=1 Tax=Campylobacter sp. VTCC 70190 TaxID=3392118 RepID=UPI00398E6234